MFTLQSTEVKVKNSHPCFFFFDSIGVLSTAETKLELEQNATEDSGLAVLYADALK